MSESNRPDGEFRVGASRFAKASQNTSTHPPGLSPGRAVRLRWWGKFVGFIGRSIRCEIAPRRGIPRLSPRTPEAGKDSIMRWIASILTGVSELAVVAVGMGLMLVAAWFVF